MTVIAYLALPAIFSFLSYAEMFPQVVHVKSGRLSMYHPGDGHCGDTTACGKTFKMDDVHIALRTWRKWGCGRKVIVCSKITGRCIPATIQDGGPYGVYTGKLKNAKKEGRWKVWTKTVVHPPKGWKWRGVADLSYGLWAKLGKPKFLSHIKIYFFARSKGAKLRRTAQK
jgi:hypothetical protein